MNSASSSRRGIDGVHAFLFLCAGLASVVLFHFNIYLPIAISIAIYLWVSVFFIQSYRHKHSGLLMLLLWLVYALPFIHIVPYLWFDFDSSISEFMWGLRTNPYMFEQEIIKLTGMLGAVGGIGMALGVSLSQLTMRSTGRFHNKRWGGQPVLSTIMSTFWVLIAIVLFELASPNETLFQAVYTQSFSFLEGAGFDSAWLIGSVLFAFVFADACIDMHLESRRWKMISCLGALAFVVIYCQLLRGDRETVPLVFGLALVYYHWAPLPRKGIRKNKSWGKIAGIAGLLVVVSMFLGAARMQLAGTKTFNEILLLFDELSADGIIGFGQLFHGSWSAVLLTPLSVAGDYYYNQLDLNMGKDYLDFLLSIPPGFVVNAFGYTRPINAYSGPAWEMTYGLGGTHAVVVPFMNFRMLGVLIIPALWSFFCRAAERNAYQAITVPKLAFLAVAAAVAPHWLWYGEKNAITGSIIWAVFSIAHVVFAKRQFPPIRTDITQNNNKYDILHES